MTKSISKDLLDKRVSYDPNTGIYTWVSGCRKSKRAGYLIKRGYREISLYGQKFYEHRLAFISMGFDAPEMVDHINQIKTDNRWCNLRPADMSLNVINRKTRAKSGLRGVQKTKTSFLAYINSKYIGSFKTAEDAARAYNNAAVALYGDRATLNSVA